MSYGPNVYEKQPSLYIGRNTCLGCQLFPRVFGFHMNLFLLQTFCGRKKSTCWPYPMEIHGKIQKPASLAPLTTTGKIKAIKIGILCTVESSLQPNCVQFNISLSCFLYTTGKLNAYRVYKDWNRCMANGIEKKNSKYNRLVSFLFLFLYLFASLIFLFQRI